MLYRASGTVRGKTTVTLTSKVAGFVRTVAVRAGDRVAAGQALVELEADDTRAAVARQRAELAHAIDARAEAQSEADSARAAADLARQELARDQRLVDSGAITRQAFEQVEARARATAAQLAAAEARIRSAASGIDISRASLSEGQATLGYARVVAPFAGRVLERLVEPGALASPATPLLVLDDGASTRVEAAVDESRASQIHPGDPVAIELANRPPITGTVGEIVPTVDVAARSFVVKIDLPGDAAALQPGTFARVGFATGARPRLVVPTTAIRSLGALDRIFVIDDHTARLRMVALGEVRGGWTEVLAGLSSGERVVADPAPSLRDGSAVEAP